MRSLTDEFVGRAVVLGLVLLATAIGCAGSTSSGFADQVCSVSLKNATDMLDALRSLNSAKPTAGGRGRNELLAHVLAGSEIAERYAAEIQQVRSPDSSVGQQAKDFLDFAAEGAVVPFTEAKQEIVKLPIKISARQSSGQLRSLELTFSRSLSEMVVPPTNIALYVPGMKQEFESTEACRQLSQLSSS
jgi:hypothetical protein